MANLETLSRLLSGVDDWNRWRRRIFELPDFMGYVRIDLEEANLVGANLTRADLSWANLRRARLGSANLTRANLTGADLTGADLEEADLEEADLEEADLTGADLTGANLRDTKISEDQLKSTRSHDLSKSSPASSEQSTAMDSETFNLESDPPELRIFLDPGEATVEQTRAVLRALSDLHVAYGGLGLEFVADELFVKVRQEVPV